MLVTVNKIIQKFDKVFVRHDLQYRNALFHCYLLISPQYFLDWWNEKYKCHTKLVSQKIKDLTKKLTQSRNPLLKKPKDEFCFDIKSPNHLSNSTAKKFPKARPQSTRDSKQRTKREPTQNTQQVFTTKPQVFSRPTTPAIQPRSNFTKETIVPTQDHQPQPEFFLFGLMKRLARSKRFWALLGFGSILVLLHRKSTATSKIRLQTASSSMPEAKPTAAAFFDDFFLPT